MLHCCKHAPRCSAAVWSSAAACLCSGLTRAERLLWRRERKEKLDGPCKKEVFKIQLDVRCLPRIAYCSCGCLGMHVSAPALGACGAACRAYPAS
jgi:hypothetical protein